ncbi:MAG: hypothetical protein NUW37_14955 [Planctomycetes bacterium]|nr:hypothetical protein [Planctomycetota bacterium]
MKKRIVQTAVFSLFIFGIILLSLDLGSDLLFGEKISQGENLDSLNITETQVDSEPSDGFTEIRPPLPGGEYDETAFDGDVEHSHSGATVSGSRNGAQAPREQDENRVIPWHGTQFERVSREPVPSSAGANAFRNFRRDSFNSAHSIYDSPLNGDELREYFKPGKSFGDSDTETETDKYPMSESIRKTIFELLDGWYATWDDPRRSIHFMFSSPIRDYDRWSSIPLMEYISEKTSNHGLSRYFDIDSPLFELARLGDERTRNYFSALSIANPYISGIPNTVYELSYPARNLNEISLFALLLNGGDPDVSRFPLLDIRIGSMISNYFLVGIREDPAFAPILIERLDKLKKMRPPYSADGVFSQEYMSFTEFQVSLSLVRSLGFSFGSLKENLNVENWEKLFSDIKAGNDHAPNMIQQHFEQVERELTNGNPFYNELMEIYPEYPEIIASFGQFEPFLNAFGPWDLSYIDFDKIAPALTLSQFGSSYMPKIIESLRTCHYDHSSQRRYFYLLALQYLEHEEASAYLSEMIENGSGGETLSSVVASRALNTDIRGLELAVDNYYLACLIVARVTRNPALLESIRKRLILETDTLYKVLLILVHGFIEPDEIFIPELIEMLEIVEDEQREKPLLSPLPPYDEEFALRQLIVRSLVLHSGHTFGRMGEDTRLSSWKDWWNTPADQRTR